MNISTTQNGFAHWVALVLVVAAISFAGVYTLNQSKANTLPGGGGGTTKVTKLLVVVEENHSYTQMKTSMPYAFSLGKKYGYASNYIATRHPSLPNYLAIVGGSTFGVADDKLPAYHKIKGRSVFGQAIIRGKTAKLYAESMSRNCLLTSASGSYFTRHNPWTYFVDERTSCNRYDVPYSQFATDVSAGRLPNAGMLVPNTCNDAHNCSLARADSWFKAIMQKVFAGPDWKSGRLAVVLTADEDNKRSGNHVLTVVIHPSLSGKVVTTKLTHYSLSRLYSNVLGTSGLRNAASAPSMSAAFRLPL